MSTSRQERRQLGRSLKALGKTPLSEFEVSPFGDEISFTAKDVKLAVGRCAVCLSTSGERKSCRACGFVRYCNRECQTAGWPSHKLICRLLAVDREIVVKWSVPSSLLPLDTILSRLRSGGHFEAYEAVVHLHIWVDRCGPTSDSEEESSAAPGHIDALIGEISASGGVALLVPGLAAGGLRALETASLLASLVGDHPEMGAAIIDAGALPLLINLVALSSTRADFEDYQSCVTAADGAVSLLRRLVDCELGPSVLDGALPALVNYLDFASREPSESRPPARSSSRLERSVRALATACAIFEILSQNDDSEDDDGFDAVAARSCIASGAVPLFISALGSDDGRLASAACAVLSRLVTQSKDGAVASLVGSEPSKIIALFRMRKPAGIGAPGAGAAAIVKQRATAEREATQDALSLMKDILEFAPERGPAFSAAGALPPLVALLGDSSNYAVDSTALALDGLFTSDPSSVGVAFDEGVLEILLALLERAYAEPGVFPRENVLGALAAMMGPATLEQKTRAVARGAVQLFSKCFADSVSKSSADEDVLLRCSARLALAKCFPDAEGEASPFFDSVADQILGPLPPSLLVKMIRQQNLAYEATLVSKLVVRSPAHHKAFIDAALPQGLVAYMTRAVTNNSYLFEARLYIVLFLTCVGCLLLQTIVLWHRSEVFFPIR